MAFKETVGKVLDGIGSGMMFDSHYVINQLIKNDSDEYLMFCANYAGTEKPTLRSHQEIGKVIKQFNDKTVSKQEHLSLSENIHGNSSTCALRLKL